MAYGKSGDYGKDYSKRWGGAGYSSAGGGMSDLLERLFQTYQGGNQESEEEERRRRRQQLIAQSADRAATLAAAMQGSWEGGRTGEAMLAAAIGNGDTWRRQQEAEIERRRRYGEVSREEERRNVEAQISIAEARRRIDEETAERERTARLSAALAEPPEGVDVDPRVWAELSPKERMEAHSDAAQSRAKQEQQQKVADLVAAEAERRGGSGDAARNMIMAGATPGQALEAAMPPKPEGGLTPYQQMMRQRYEADDAAEAEEDSLKQAEKEREAEAIARELRSAGMEPSGVLAVDRMRYQRLLVDPTFAALSTTAVPPTAPSAKPVARGVPVAGSRSVGASVFRGGGTPTNATTENPIIAQREKQADTIIRAAGLPAEAVGDAEVRAWILVELAKPGAKPETILATLRRRWREGL